MRCGLSVADESHPTVAPRTVAAITRGRGEQPCVSSRRLPQVTDPTTTFTAVNHYSFKETGKCLRVL